MSTYGTAPAAVHPHSLSTHVAVEALGSFFVVFVGLATALFSASTSAVAFGYGLALVAALIAFGNVSNGYFNPAFSLAMAVAGRIKWLPMVLYVVAQTIGAVLASCVIYALVKVIPSDSTGGVAKVFGTLASGFDDHSPLKVPMVGVMIVEIVATAVLVAVILAATRSTEKNALAPFGIGLALAVTVTVALPVGNTALNPAASASVVFLTDSWAAGQLWLFWLAPLFGAALAAAIFRTFVPLPSVAGVGTVGVGADDSGTDDVGTIPPRDLAKASSATAVDDVDAAGVDADADATDADASDADGLPAAAAVPTAAAPETLQPAQKKNDAQDFFDAPRK